MTFIDERLPPRIAAGFKGGPLWNTRINTRRNGRENRNRQWLHAQYKYTANFGAFNDADRQTLVRIFQATAGRWAAFRFKDPTDYFVTGEVLAPEFGTSTPIQLIRTYWFGSASSVSLIQAPVGGTVTVYRNGVAVAGTLDAMTGIFTPAAPWALGDYTWSGQYDRWVRFDSDWGAFVANAQGVWTADMELIEVPR